KNAARHWAGSETGKEEEDEEYLAALQGFGAPAELVEAEQREAAEESAPFEVFEDNWLTVQTFLALQTQWEKAVVVGESAIFIYSGIRYESFGTAMVMAGAPRAMRREIYLGVQLMEYAALAVLNKSEGEPD